MTTLKIGIASAAEYKARTMAIARGELKPSPKSPKVWFTSIESMAKVLSDRNRNSWRSLQTKSLTPSRRLPKEQGAPSPICRGP